MQIKPISGDVQASPLLDFACTMLTWCLLCGTKSTVCASNYYIITFLNYYIPDLTGCQFPCEYVLNMSFAVSPKEKLYKIWLSQDYFVHLHPESKELSLKL